MSPILQLYKADLEEAMTEVTIAGKIQVLYDIECFLKSKKKEWQDLTFDLVKEYFTILREKGIFREHSRDIVKPNSPRTLLGKFRRLSAFLTWILDVAEEREEEPIIPKKEIKKIKMKIKSPKIIGRDQRGTKRRALSEEQVAKIRKEITSPVIRNMFDIGLNLGLRRIEYGRIKLEHVHLDEGYIDITGKGFKIRDLALTKEMKELIEYQLSLRKLNNIKHDFLFFHLRTKGRLRGSALNSIYLKISKKVGFVWNAHEVRYTMDALMMKRGVPVNIIAQRMGHSKSLTFHYARELLEERLRILKEKVGIL